MKELKLIALYYYICDCYDKELKWQKDFTLRLHNQGVPLMAGSDTYGLFLPGFSLHHELELIHSSGLSTYETLKTATVNPARYLNTIALSGTIAEGKLADIVLLDKNPLENIENTQYITYVMANGRLYDAETLNEIGNRSKEKPKLYWEANGYNQSFEWHEETQSFMHDGCTH